MEASYSSGDDNDDVMVSRPASKSPPLESAQPVPLIPVTMPSFPSPSSKKKEIQKKKKMSPSCDEIAVREEKSKFFNSLRVRSPSRSAHVPCTIRHLHHCLIARVRVYFYRQKAFQFFCSFDVMK